MHSMQLNLPSQNHKIMLLHICAFWKMHIYVICFALFGGLLRLQRCQFVTPSHNTGGGGGNRPCGGGSTTSCGPGSSTLF